MDNVYWINYDMQTLAFKGLEVSHAGVSGNEKLLLFILFVMSFYLFLKARCIYTSPGNATCICNEGWAGDGQACVEIDNCLLNNRGGCHYNADCITQGPGQVPVHFCNNKNIIFVLIAALPHHQ